MARGNRTQRVETPLDVLSAVEGLEQRLQRCKLYLGERKSPYLNRDETSAASSDSEESDLNDGLAAIFNPLTDREVQVVTDNDPFTTVTPAERLTLELRYLLQSYWAGHQGTSLGKVVIQMQLILDRFFKQIPGYADLMIKLDALEDVLRSEGYSDLSECFAEYDRKKVIVLSHADLLKSVASDLITIDNLWNELDASKLQGLDAVAARVLQAEARGREQLLRARRLQSEMDRLQDSHARVMELVWTAVASRSE